MNKYGVKNMEKIPVVSMYEVVEYLCRKNRISIAQMCREIGMRQSIITDLKHGRTKSLSHTNMVKIANYFQISTDVFNEGVLEETLPTQIDAECVAGFHFLSDKKNPAPEIRDGIEENNTPLVYGYEEPEILPTIYESKQEQENADLDDMEKTLLELFRSLSMVEKCKLITEIEEKCK